MLITIVVIAIESHRDMDVLAALLEREAEQREAILRRLRTLNGFGDERDA